MCKSASYFQAQAPIHAFKHYYLKRASWKSQEEFKIHVRASWPESTIGTPTPLSGHGRIRSCANGSQSMLQIHCRFCPAATLGGVRAGQRAANAASAESTPAQDQQGRYHPAAARVFQRRLAAGSSAAGLAAAGATRGRLPREPGVASDGVAELAQPLSGPRNLGGSHGSVVGQGPAAAGGVVAEPPRRDGLVASAKLAELEQLGRTVAAAEAELL